MSRKTYHYIFTAALGVMFFSGLISGRVATEADVACAAICAVALIINWKDGILKQ